MNPLRTTLNDIYEAGPCLEGWRKILKGLGKTRPDDEALNFSSILQHNGLNEALWATRAAPQYLPLWRLFGVNCCLRIKHLLSDEHKGALEVAHRYSQGEVTEEELAETLKPIRLLPPLGRNLYANSAVCSLLLKDGEFDLWQVVDFTVDALCRTEPTASLATRRRASEEASLHDAFGLFVSHQEGTHE